MRFKAVDPSITEHAVEQRGFVEVTFDDAQPEGEKIDIFYRLIPSYDLKPEDPSKPIILVMNGGPGIPSSYYRPLEFDYTEATSTNREKKAFDRFQFFLKTHRILLVDQRGTDGQSAPLDMDDPNLDANLVARFFSSDSHARDYAAVIDAVIPKGEPFFIIAQSYGGMPGMQYLALPGDRRPNGIVFSCSALPYENGLEQMLCRRREQLKLNLQLRAVFPDIEQRLQSVKNHYTQIGVDPARIHVLFTELGKGVAWEKSFVEKLERILTQTREEFEQNQEKLGEVNLLNYILSSANFTPGYTDRTCCEWTSAQVPLESWMIDENRVLTQVGQDGSWRENFIAQMDRKPPPATPFPSVEVLQKAIGQNQLLFTPADNDAFVPAEAYVKALEIFQVAGHTEVRRLPGGHHAIFLEQGHIEFIDWARDKI